MPHQRLTQIEEIELTRSLKQHERGSKEYCKILHRIVTHNVGLVKRLVNKFPIRNSTCSFDDLYQEGIAGLIHAIEKFDPSMGYRLSTYSYNWINSYIRRYYQNHGRAVRVPVHMSDKQMKLNKQIEVLTSELGRVPTSDEIKEVNTDTETIISTMMNNVSLNQLIGEGSELESLIADEGSEEKFESQVDAEILLMKLKPLVSDRDYQILIHRYGLNGEGEYTLSELSDKFGVTKARCHQIHHKLIDVMKTLV